MVISGALNESASGSSESPISSLRGQSTRMDQAGAWSGSGAPRTDPAQTTERSTVRTQRTTATSNSAPGELIESLLLASRAFRGFVQQLLFFFGQGAHALATDL